MIKFRQFLVLLAMLGFACGGAPSALAQDAQISLEQRMLLRCSATFALVADAQENGREEGRSWPDMSEKGKEFFVRSAGQVMDETKLDQSAVRQILMRETIAISEGKQIKAMMQICLPFLPSLPQQ